MESFFLKSDILPPTNPLRLPSFSSPSKGITESFRMPWRDVGRANSDSLRSKGERRVQETPPADLRPIGSDLQAIARNHGIQRASRDFYSWMEKAGIIEWMKTYPAYARTGMDAMHAAGASVITGEWKHFLAEIPNLVKTLPYGFLSGTLVPLPIPKPWAWIFWAYVVWAINNPKEKKARLLWTYLAPRQFAPKEHEPLSFKDFLNGKRF